MQSHIHVRLRFGGATCGNQKAGGMQAHSWEMLIRSHTAGYLVKGALNTGSIKKMSCMSTMQCTFGKSKVVILYRNHKTGYCTSEIPLVGQLMDRESRMFLGRHWHWANTRMSKCGMGYQAFAYEAMFCFCRYLLSAAYEALRAALCSLLWTCFSLFLRRSSPSGHI